MSAIVGYTRATTDGTKSYFATTSQRIVNA